MKYEIFVNSEKSEKAESFDTIRSLFEFIKIELVAALQYGGPVIDFKIYFKP